MNYMCIILLNFIWILAAFLPLEKGKETFSVSIVSEFSHALWLCRFDDTNPEAEKKEYIDHIKEIVQWMGWEPFKV